MEEEKKPVATPKVYEPFQPSHTFVLSVRVFELVSGLTTMACLAYAASGHHHMSGNVPGWLALGLVVSSTGALLSLAFIIERTIKFPLFEFLTSTLWSIAYLVYVIYGALNTPASITCQDLDAPTGWEVGTCAAPKAAEFFAFVAIFAYGFSGFTGLRVWWSRRREPSSGATAQA